MIIESISGVRGITPFFLSPEKVRNYTSAFHQHCTPGAIFVGRDSRSTGSEFQDIVVEELSLCGRDVFVCGIVPTPTVQFMVEHTEAAGGMVITASHNPSEWNGLKFIRSDGVFLHPDECEYLYLSAKSGFQSRAETQGMVLQDTNAIQKHIIHQTCLSCIDVNSIRNRRFKVVVDACNGAGSEALPEMLEAIGCEVITIHCDPKKEFPRGTEPLPENLDALCDAVRTNDADAGFATDPDADRLAVVSEKGFPLGEEYTLVLAAEGFLKSVKTPGETFVVNLSTSLALEKMAEPYGINVIYAPVGEINVVQKMLESRALLGGEGNGGVILKESHLGRDSLTGVTLLLNRMSQSDQPLSKIFRSLPQFSIIKDKISTDGKQISSLKDELKKQFHDSRINESDGIKFTWENSWIHFRKSNTEPILRIYAEAKNDMDAKNLIRKARNTIE
jgi:phosphomannomutase